MRFDINVLDEERSRIAELLKDTGFYRFTKSDIRFDADTAIGNNSVALTMNIPLYRSQPRHSHRPPPLSLRQHTLPHRR